MDLSCQSGQSQESSLCMNLAPWTSTPASSSEVHGLPSQICTGNSLWTFQPEVGTSDGHISLLQTKYPQTPVFIHCLYHLPPSTHTTPFKAASTSQGPDLSNLPLGSISDWLTSALGEEWNPGGGLQAGPSCSSQSAAMPAHSGRDSEKTGQGGPMREKVQSFSSQIWALRIQSRCDRRSSRLPLLWSPHTGKAGLRSDLLPKSLAYSNPLQPFPLSYCQIFTRFGVWPTHGHTGQQRLYRTHAY